MAFLAEGKWVGYRGDWAGWAVVLAQVFGRGVEEVWWAESPGHGLQLEPCLIAHHCFTPPTVIADTPGLLTAVAGRLTGSAAVFDSDWDMPGLPGDLAIGEFLPISMEQPSGGWSTAQLPVVSKGSLRVVYHALNAHVHPIPSHKPAKPAMPPITLQLTIRPHSHLPRLSLRPPPRVLHQQRDGAGAAVAG